MSNFLSTVTMTEANLVSERRRVATWRREGSDVGLELRAFHVKERREYWVTLSRFVEESREGSAFVARKYAPMDDIKTVSRIPVARYSAKTLAEAYVALHESISSDLASWLGWADAIERH